MTQTETQTKSMELASNFDRVKFKFLDAKPGDRIPFEFNYSGDIPIYGITKSCGCVANVAINETGIKGTYDVGNNFKHVTNPVADVQQHFTVFFDDGEPYSVVRNGVIVTNPAKPRVILSLDGQVIVNAEEEEDTQETS